MPIVTVAVAVPATAGVGAPTSVATMAADKTFILEGSLIGAIITVEGRITTAGPFTPLFTMQRSQGSVNAPGEIERLTVMLSDVRVRTNFIQSASSPLLRIAAETST